MVYRCQSRGWRGYGSDVGVGVFMSHAVNFHNVPITHSAVADTGGWGWG